MKGALVDRNEPKPRFTATAEEGQMADRRGHRDIFGTGSIFRRGTSFPRVPRAGASTRRVSPPPPPPVTFPGRGVSRSFLKLFAGRIRRALPHPKVAGKSAGAPETICKFNPSPLLIIDPLTAKKKEPEGPG